MSVSGAFATLADSIERSAADTPNHVAARIGAACLTYAQLDRLGHRVAAALIREGLAPGSAFAVVASTRLDYLGLMVGAARAGLIIVPLPVSAGPDAIAAMAHDAGSRLLFTDQPLPAGGIPLKQLETDFDEWLSPEDVHVPAVPVTPGTTATIIYSSGTTGRPKGIVQSHLVRWRMLCSGAARGLDDMTVALFATPLYSNMTLSSMVAVLGAGGTVVLMPKFDAGQWLRLSETLHVNHATVAPVMMQRILAHPEFETTDLSAYGIWLCMSAPCSPTLKAEILQRWHGEFIELYGLTEGGPSFLLHARANPDKLGTVGRLAPGCRVKILDDEDREVPTGEQGEVVGWSAGMMTGYHDRPDETAASRWRAPDGLVWQRTGDVGRLDADGFLTLVDRKKDMIISGGFNIYPSDIEAQLEKHPAVREASVVGVPSETWGETPVAFVVAPGEDGEAIRQWLNDRLGKTQRVSAVRFVDALPRSPIGKVLKRTLRDMYQQG